ncbi:MAG: NAD(P)/FAD-dependent oxidoreductase [Candidatus Helarchaeota archaeon]
MEPLAGATCGEILAKAGLEVVLFEKGKRMRYKTCAGGSMWNKSG